jgi:hypothetical protein
MLRIVSLATLTYVQLLGSLGYCQAADQKPQASMIFSCDRRPFLSVSVSTPKRDRIPQSQIRVTGPLSRQQGFGVSAKPIPQSHYKDVVEVPKWPDRSREHAVEVCGAQQGGYALTVYEHGDERYRITVGVNMSDFMSANLHSREGRIRRYRFFLSVKNDRVHLTWLDKNRQPQFDIGNNDW